MALVPLIKGLDSVSRIQERYEEKSSLAGFKQRSKNLSVSILMTPLQSNNKSNRGNYNRSVFSHAPSISVNEHHNFQAMSKISLEIRHALQITSV